MRMFQALGCFIVLMLGATTSLARQEEGFTTQLLWGFSREIYAPISPPASGVVQVTYRSTDPTRLLLKVNQSNGVPFAEQAVGTVSSQDDPGPRRRFRAVALPVQQLGPVDVIASIAGRPDIRITVDIVAPPISFPEFSSYPTLVRWDTKSDVTVCRTLDTPLYTATKLEYTQGLSIRYFSDPPGRGIFEFDGQYASSITARLLPGFADGDCALHLVDGQLAGKISFVGIEPGDVAVRAEILELPMVPPITRSFTVTNGYIAANPLWEFREGMQGMLSIRLSGPHHGGQTVTIRPTTPGRVLLSEHEDEVGSESLTVYLQRGVPGAYIYANLLDGAVGDIKFELLTEGLPPRLSVAMPVLNTAMDVRRPVLSLRESEGPFVATVNFEGRVLRPGGPARYAVFSTSDPDIAAIIGPDGREYSSVEVPITRDSPRNSSGMYEAVSFVARSTGRACITGHPAGVSPLPGQQCDVRVLMADDVILPRASYKIGSGLSVENQLIELGRVADHQTFVHVRSTDPELVLIQRIAGVLAPEFVTSANQFELNFVGAPGATGAAEIEISGEGVPTTYVPVEVVAPALRVTLPALGARSSDPPNARSSGWVDLGTPTADGSALEEIQPVPRSYPLPITLQVSSTGPTTFGSSMLSSGCTNVGGGTVVVCSHTQSSSNRSRVLISISGCSSDTATVTASAPGFTACPMSSAQTRLSMQGDVNADGRVSFIDVTIVLSNFGNTYPSFNYSDEPMQGHPGDANGDRTVNFQDVLSVLNYFNRNCS